MGWGKWAAKNKTARKAYCKKWYAENYDSAKKRTADLHYKYGISDEEYAGILAYQGGRCALCRGRPNGQWKRLHVDHDHRTGQVRGLLCYRCNSAIGYFNDDPEVLEHAALYVKTGGACSEGCSSFVVKAAPRTPEQVDGLSRPGLSRNNSLETRSAPPSSGPWTSRR